MNLILVCLFNLLLFNSCLAANIGSSRNDIRQENRSGNGAQASKFNEDFVYPIFDIAEFEQILQMAKKPDTADFVKNHVFPVKYQNYEFGLISRQNLNVEMHPKAVHISDFNIFVDVITHFGEHIKIITIADSEQMNVENAAILNERLSEHCSNSLSFLTFGYIKEHTFKNFTKPFPNMKNLEFVVRTDEIEFDLPFNEIFPNMENLCMSYIGNVGGVNNNPNNAPRFIESEPPVIDHLKYLVVHYNWINNEDVPIIKKHIGNMLHKNPHIQKLHYRNKLDDFIHEINEYLPNLEDLTVHAIDTEIQPVQFENVKHFKVTSWGETIPTEKITFSRLQTLNIYYAQASFGISRESWMEFFRNHQNLSQITCEAFQENGLVDFLAELPNLREIQIRSWASFHLDFVTQLIDSQNNLVKLVYNANPRDESVELNMDGFHDKFENEWNITYTEGRSFIALERKN